MSKKKEDKIFWFFFKLFFPQWWKELKQLREEVKKAQNTIRLKQIEIAKRETTMRQLERKMRKTK